VSLQVSEFPILKCLGLSVGSGVCLATLALWHSKLTLRFGLCPTVWMLPKLIPSDVVVDTVPAGRSTLGQPEVHPVPYLGLQPEVRPVPSLTAKLDFCEFVNGQYTVMYQPESQPNQSFPWATPALGDGWTSETLPEIS